MMQDIPSREVVSLHRTSRLTSCTCPNAGPTPPLEHPGAQADLQSTYASFPLRAHLLATRLLRVLRILMQPHLTSMYAT